MPFRSIAAALVAPSLLAAAFSVQAQSTQPVQAPPGAGAVVDSKDGPAPSSALSAELFYQLLIGEISLRNGDNAVGYTLYLEAARKSGNAQLFERAVEIALQSRNGEAALQTARAWAQALPLSREANRYVLQILLALNRVAETAEPLSTELRLAGPLQSVQVMQVIPGTYARAADKAVAASVVEQALAVSLQAPETAPTAWATVGRMRLMAGDRAGALQAAQAAVQANATNDAGAFLALELMQPGAPQAEALLRQQLERNNNAELRLGYSRALLDDQRYAESTTQIERVTREQPDNAQAWLIQGALLAQTNQLAQAEAALRRYVELAQGDGPRAPRGDERSRGLAQAYLTLAQVAEKRRDFTQAEVWLNQIENSEELSAAQSRRASILARQGKLDEARRIVRSLPVRGNDGNRVRLLAEVNLLRDVKQYQQAYDLMVQAAANDQDPDLWYDKAMLADKLGRFDEMETLLRRLIAQRPDYHHAYNALGYSMADRSVRLVEARELILKALTFAPDDPFITDSLGWVEFRMGNGAEALRILDSAYKNRQDSEIAAHLGEVLWSLGQRERARQIWQEGLLLDADNETLQETLKRFGVRP